MPLPNAHKHKLCGYIYTGQADYTTLFAKAKSELAAAGWVEDKKYPFAKDGAKFNKPRANQNSPECWVMFKRDAKVEMGSAGRLITRKARGWISVRCLLIGDPPGLLDKLSGLRMPKSSKS